MDPEITDAQAKHLVAAAQKARENAYAPYSKYQVGAAVLTENGEIFGGCNVENASYGLTVCAERNAVFAAVAAGHRRIVAVAVVTTDGASMCGACRQVVSEFGPSRVFLADTSGRYRETTSDELLPGAFDGKDLR